MRNPLAASGRPFGFLRASIAVDWLAIILLALLVQAPGLLHWIDSNPLPLLSPLGQGGHPGLLPGSPGWIDPNYGTTTQALGHLAASSWLAGIVPWWNPYNGVGVPLAAEMQPAALFLPFVLLLHLHDGLLWLRAALCAVAGLGAYELLRALGLRRAACVAGGLLFAFNGTAAWLPHGPERAAAFLPLILLGVERARTHALAGRKLGWLWAAAGLALSLYAGFPETAYLDGLLAAAWTLWRLAAPFAGQPAVGGRAAWMVRRRLLGKMAAGLVVALLIAAPAIWPFALYLRHSDIGLHAAGFAHVPLPPNAFPMFLLPYLYGPIDGFGATYPYGATLGAWGEIGGYVGAAACVLAILRLLGRRGGDGGLRWLLAGWIALCLAKTASLPGVTGAMNLLPLMRQIAFFRYAEPSWQLAVIVLAALAVDEWQRAGLSRWRAALGAAVGVGLVAAALWLAWPTMRALAPLPGWRPFATVVVGWAVLLAVLLPLLLAGPARSWRRAAVVALVGLDAVGMFALPLASASRGVTLDRAPLDFLRAHLGLQRFYSMTALPPNYGAMFGLAQINDDMLPVPRLWADHIRAALDPQAVPVTFSGGNAGRPPGSDARAMLFRHVDAYRALGVRYVITPRGADSLDGALASGRFDVQGAAWGLAPGGTLSGRLPSGFAQGHAIDAMSVSVGTYFGRADGVLAAMLCTASACAHGSAALRGAADNAGLDIALSPALRVGPNDTPQFTLTHVGGTQAVAIWLLPGSVARINSPPGAEAGAGPGLVLSYPTGPPGVRRVFRDAHVDIFELPDPAPYFSAGPSCALAVAGRRYVTATCDRPATLLRRELAFPGWRVRVGGRPAKLGGEGIFQTVALPAGRSLVLFHYAPRFIGAAYIAAGVGVLWVLLAWIGTTNRGRFFGRALLRCGRPFLAGAADFCRLVFALLPSRGVRDRAAIVVLALLVQLPGLLHLIDTDPLLRLTTLAFGGHPGLLPGMPGWIDPNIGTTTQALGHAAAQSWLAGELPWWNPYSGVGVPLAAEMQPAALFLPFVLLLHFTNGLLWLRAAMCVVAGLGAYELTLALGLRRAACLAAGVLFAFNGTIAWLPHGPERASAFLPLILLGVERARWHAIQGRPLGWLWIASGLAFSLYAGFPEAAYLDGLFIAVWTMFRLMAPLAMPTPMPTVESPSWMVRGRLLGKAASGVVAGLLLSGPVVWPFLHYVGMSDVGSHARGFADTALATNAFPMFLLPYLYGSIDAFGTYPGGPTWLAWGNVGGYVGGAAAVLALLGLAGARGRALRLTLAGWIMVCFAKTAALPGVTAVVNLLPLMHRTAFFRYAEPSWSLAAIVLAALAIDEWQRVGLSRLRVASGSLAALLLVAAALWLAWPTMVQLAPLRGYRPFASCQVVWCVMFAILLPALLGRAPDRRRIATVVALVALDAIAMFALPLLSATRGVMLDSAPIMFLQTHLGLERFYALGDIPPNYGALFGIASINDDMLPVPREWADYVHEALDPLAEPSTFSGAFGGRRPGPDPGDMLYRRLDAYRALGVRYVVTPGGTESLGSRIAADSPGTHSAPLPLAPGESVAGHLPPGFAQGQRIDKMVVKVGTYGGRAAGALDGTLCTPVACAHGTAALRGAPDNIGMDITIDPPLATTPGEPLTFRLTRRSGSGPLALWMFEGSAARIDAAKALGYGLGLALSYENPGHDLVRVFHDRRADIFAVPEPAPYFSAGPLCSLDVGGRRALIATCSDTATLTRRELAFPGWRATVDGRPAALGVSGLFQTLALPRGRSLVRFAYAPPHIALAYAAAALGAAWMLLAWFVAVCCAGWRRASRAG